MIPCHRLNSNAVYVCNCVTVYISMYEFMSIVHANLHNYLCTYIHCLHAYNNITFNYDLYRHTIIILYTKIINYSKDISSM